MVDNLDLETSTKMKEMLHGLLETSMKMKEKLHGLLLAQSPDHTMFP